MPFRQRSIVWLRGRTCTYNDKVMSLMSSYDSRHKWSTQAALPLLSPALSRVSYLRRYVDCLVCVDGFEPPTTRFQGEDSGQTELHTDEIAPHSYFSLLVWLEDLSFDRTGRSLWSGYRGSNPITNAWKAQVCPSAYPQN